MRKRFPDLNLAFVGSAKNGYSKVVELVDRLGLEKNIHFLGYVPKFANGLPVSQGTGQ